MADPRNLTRRNMDRHVVNCWCGSTLAIMQRRHDQWKLWPTDRPHAGRGARDTCRSAPDLAAAAAARGERALTFSQAHIETPGTELLGPARAGDSPVELRCRDGNCRRGRDLDVDKVERRAKVYRLKVTRLEEAATAAAADSFDVVTVHWDRTTSVGRELTEPAASAPARRPCPGGLPFRPTGTA
jgi:hypothetical protein